MFTALHDPAPSRRGVVPIVLIIALAVGMSVYVVRALLPHLNSPAGFDEAVHLLPILQLAHDVRAGRVIDFLKHSYEQDGIALYPFAHSWLVTPLLVVGGSTASIGRLAGLVFLIFAAGAAYAIGGELSRPHARPVIGGCLSAGFILTCLPLWVYAGVAHVESAGLLFTLLCLWAYIRAGEGHQRPYWLVSASLLLAGALFTKYSFGAFLLAGVVLNEALGLLATKAWPDRKRLIALLLPIGVLALLWFIRPEKLHRFWVYSRSQGQSYIPWTFTSLSFYPVSLLRHYSIGPVMGAVLVAGLVRGGVVWRTYSHRVMLSYLLGGLALLTSVPQKEIRFFYTVAPAAYPLASACVIWITTMLWSRWPSVWARRALLAAGILLASLQALWIQQRFSFLDAALEVTFPAPQTREAYEWLMNSTLRRGVRPYLLNDWHLLSAYALEWEYLSRYGGEPAVFSYQLALSSLAPEPLEENLKALTAGLEEIAPAALISIDGSPAGAYTGWHVAEPLLAQGRLDEYPESASFSLHTWPARYWDQVLAGDFATPLDLERERAAQRIEIQVTLHMYTRREP